MNIIRQMREQAKVTQQQLAKCAGTSQPTIALYEAGVKSPTIGTLSRLASSLGLDLSIEFVPSLTREDRRSLAYHRAIAKIVQAKPSASLLRARRTLSKMKAHHRGAKKLFDKWERWLTLPLEELISNVLDPGMTARDMRQVTPFAGLLSASERARILKQFRRGEQQ